MTCLASSRLALALRNLFRHRSRTIATLFAIVLGVASMILAGGFVQDILIQLGEATIHSQTGHIQLATPSYWESRSRSSDTHMIKNSTPTIKILEAQPGIEQIVSRINFVGMLSNGKRDLAIIGEGIEPDGERRIGSFIRYSEGRPLENTDTDGVIIGQGIARLLDLHVGDHVTLIISLAQGAVNTMDLQIIGIFQSFSKEFDSRAIRIPLKATQELLDTKSVHVIVMALNNTNETDPTANTISALVENQGVRVRTWRQLSDFYEKTVRLYGAQFGVLRLIIFLMVLLSVANSINMTLYERTREFGTLLSLGDRPQTVFELIMIENVMLGLIGAGLGIFAGCTIALAISAIGVPMPPPPNSNLGYIALIRLEPLAVLSSGTIGFWAAVFAALYPAYRATKVNIVDALRHGV
jgi:putative ABC transport system permease protein